jgi:hypothetical protein
MSNHIDVTVTALVDDRRIRQVAGLVQNGSSPSGAGDVGGVAIMQVLDGERVHGGR